MTQDAWVDRLIELGQTADAAVWQTPQAKLVWVYPYNGCGVTGDVEGGGNGTGVAGYHGLYSSRQSGFGYFGGKGHCGTIYGDGVSTGMAWETSN